ncbi:MAG: N-acetyl-gamma-glutamyl-phosphate reductase, partial [Anaerolineae bacterium]|nr:N-acetyl-gamma-glutamyl-phosphate reductase [Anaerolineae bacterium]
DTQLGVVFSPHLLSVPRGLLSTIYAPLRGGWDEDRVRGEVAAVYEGEPFVELLPPEEHASLAHVNRSNRCALGVSVVNGSALLTSAIDNLV